MIKFSLATSLTSRAFDFARELVVQRVVVVKRSVECCNHLVGNQTYELIYRPLLVLRRRIQPDQGVL